MKRLLTILYIITVCVVNVYSDSRIIRTLVETPDYQFNKYNVWRIPQISVTGGTSINSGFSIKVEFSTPAITLDDMIFAVGSSTGTAFEIALSLHENESNLTLRRQVKLGNKIASHSTEAWTKNLLERGTNYTLLLEIDETRCRYSLWEIGREPSKKYEYEFYGLTSSYVKDILSKSGSIFSLAVNPSYRVQKAIIASLGYGIGVKLPELKTDVVWGRFKNVNSAKYMDIFNSVIIKGNPIVQHSLTGNGSSLWEMKPLYQKNRTPTAYNVKLTNMSSNIQMAIANCLIYNKTPLIVTDDLDCDVWQINREQVRGDDFRLMNVKNSVYGVVSDASLVENAAVWTWESGTTPNAHWTFEETSFHAPIETGLYTIQNKNSSLYLSPALANYDSKNLVQYPTADRLSYVWYIHKEESGLYTIYNVDSQKCLDVENASLDNGANIIQWSYQGTGNEKWIIQEQPSSGYYTIRNVHSDKYMVVADASKSSGTGIIQYGTGEDNKLWNITPYSFTSPRKVGGVFRLKNIYTNLYLVVEDASMEDQARLVSWESANTPNGWWTFENLETGGYAIKNVNSQLYIVIENASLDEYALAVQYNRDGHNNLGNSLWALEPDNLGIQNIYWLKNVHSGKYLYFSSETYQNKTPAVQETSNPPHNARLRWFLEPVL